MLQYFRFTIILLSLTFISAQSQITIGDSLTGQSLLDYVTLNYKTNTTLGYSNARDTLYSIIDIHDDSLLTCVYTGFTIALNDTLDPSSDAYNKGINCEHTWPQSMGAVDEPQKSDMHHLFPVKSNVNSSRGNDPYADIPDNNTDTWYWLDTSTTTIPTIDIDLWSEKENDGNQKFEPREDHKGNAARAMFYFFAMYQDAADTNFWNVQKEALLDWHYYDPIDTNEYNRTYQIASYQENHPNPFVLDSSLARRIWFTNAANDTTVQDTILEQIVINEIMQNPTAVNDNMGEWFEIVNIGTTTVDLSGWIIKDNDTDIHTITSSVIVEPDSFIVLGRNGDYNTNGGYTADYVYSSLTLANSSDELLLINIYGITIDSVAWDDGTTFPDPAGASMALMDTYSDNSIGSNWVESDVPFGDGDFGTPGSENFPIIINNPPVALPDTVVIYEDESIMIDVLANDTDIDGDSLVLSYLDTSNTLGYASINDTLNQLLYIPPLNYFGIDSVIYMASDNIEGVDFASVYITIMSVNDPPVISPIPDHTIMYDDTLRVEIEISDVDSDSISIHSPWPFVDIRIEIVNNIVTIYSTGYTGLYTVPIIVEDDSAAWDTEQFDLTIIPPYDGPEWTIDINGSDSLGNGSPDYPYASIQKGINIVPDESTIMVAPGRYIEQINFSGKNLFISSFYEISSDTSFISQTIIDGDSSGSVVTFNSGEDLSAILSGFTITNGFSENGGGIFIQNSNPTILRNIIKQNYGGEKGAGLYIENSNSKIKYIRFYDNSYPDGYGYGGGIFINQSSPYISNCIFSNNFASAGGGIYSVFSFPIIYNSTFDHNEVSYEGPEIFGDRSDIILTNSIFYSYYGIIMHLVQNSTISITNSNFYEYFENQIYLENSEILVFEDIIYGDPLFTDPENRDFSLLENSPCIDAGSQYFIFDNDTLVNISDNSFIGSAPDMGAIESPYSLSISNQSLIPGEFALHSATPNPFNPTTTIHYELPNRSDVQITIYDLLGRKVTTLVNQTQNAGFRSVIWNATNDNGKPVSAGVYLYQIQAGEFVQTKKMILLK